MLYKETDFKKWLLDTNFKEKATEEQLEILQELENLPDNLTIIGYWMELIDIYKSVDFLSEHFRYIMWEFQAISKNHNTKLNTDKKIKKRSKLLDCATTMPPVGRKENVINWISTQEALCEWVFNHIKDDNLIVFDKSTGTWQGVDYQEERSE
mgnify:CR=1 FL=1